MKYFKDLIKKLFCLHKEVVEVTSLVYDHKVIQKSIVEQEGNHYESISSKKISSDYLIEKKCVRCDEVVNYHYLHVFY